MSLHGKLSGELGMGMETLLSVNLGTLNKTQPSIMNIVCRWAAMFSLLMTGGVMDFAAALVLDITKQIYTVGKRFSMVANLEV